MHHETPDTDTPARLIPPLKSLAEYRYAVVWLAEVEAYFSTGTLVMSPEVYQKYLDLMEFTRQQIAAYEATPPAAGD